MPNILDPVKAEHFVRPDLGQNCLQKLSADNISRYRVNQGLNLVCFSRHHSGLIWVQPVCKSKNSSLHMQLSTKISWQSLKPLDNFFCLF